MSGGGYTTVLTPSHCLEDSSCDTSSAPVDDISTSQPMLLKGESSPEQVANSPAFSIVAPHAPGVIQQNMDADYNSNSFNFSYDGSFSLSPPQELEKRPQSSSPKSSSFGHQSKSDKMISGFDSPVIAYHENGNPGGVLSRTHHILRFHPSGDAMLSALNYNESDMLQEGGFDVAPSQGFASGLDGFLGGGSGMRLPDLLDGEEAYSQDLPLSPPSQHPSFTFRDTPPLPPIVPMPTLNLSDPNDSDAKGKSVASVLTVDKLKVKAVRPAKATSPNRSGTQPCPTCGKVFSNSSALTKHKLTHSDERKYVCQLCAKAFKRQDHLNGHMLTHRNKKPFECDAEGCGKSYCDARSLRRHKENHHTAAGSPSPAPGMPALSFNSLQTSFPASVITNASSPVTFAEASLGNRIQYAPPPCTTATSASTAPRTVSATPVISSVIPTARSHLQFLTFHQQPPVGKAETEAVLTSWQPQTINNGTALLLAAQNYGGTTRSFEETSSGSEASPSPAANRESRLTDTNSTGCGEPQGATQQFKVVSSSSGAKQLVALTTQGSVNLQFDSSSIVRLQDRPAADAVYSQPTAIQLVKLEPGSEVPPSPTVKESPLLQQLLNQQHSTESQPEPTYTQQPPSAVTASSLLLSQWSQVSYAMSNSAATNRFSQDPKPVECSLCQRKFKNIPALNGHMRLHGGYFKKENETKKVDKKVNGTTPLQTASTNIRALIEEKIIQKRNFLPRTTMLSNVPNATQDNPISSHSFQSDQPSGQNVIPPVSSNLSPVTQDSPVFSNFPIGSEPPSNDVDAYDSILQRLDLKQPFRVPRPPLEKHRRHSDSDHFVLPKRPCTTFTNSALADLLRRKVWAKRSCRTGSDPGDLLLDDQVSVSFADLAASLTSLELPRLSGDTGPASFHSAIDAAASVLEASGDAALPVLSAEDIPEAQPMLVGLRDMADMEAHCLDDGNVFFESSTNDPPFPEISVSELEMMQFASTVSPSSNISGDAKPPVNGSKPKSGEESNDDDVFLSPTSLPTSPRKTKKKRRPEPLYIPPYVNTCGGGHSSRLRSPRLWDPSQQQRLSPPPYTPPPMLSPVRSGSGLFWHILGGGGSLTPKSAPITPSFGLLQRRVSSGESTPDIEEESVEAPETDVLPHVNIGSYYQAKIPAFNPNFKDALLVEHKAEKVWDPMTVEQVADEEVEAFLSLSCSAVVPGGGSNRELAHHLLHACHGSIQDAVFSLIDAKPKLPPNHPLLTYQYSENDKWNLEEIEAYHQGLLKCDKDFFSISKDMGGRKSVRQCVQFYYVWKKVCPDEYKRLRLIRRRKEHESLYYNLRSKEDGQPCSPSPPPPQKNELELVNGNDSGSPSCHFSLDEFPCKLCGKVFSKVKSRSAHMKSHRQPDSDKKSRYEL